MKVPISWLKDYCDFDIESERLADILTMAGMNVESIQNIAGDTVLDVEIPANRPDLCGILGIAREISVLLRRPLRIPSAKIVATPVPCVPGRTYPASVEVLEPILCPRYTARVMTDIRVGPSPKWLARRLESIGQRSISNIVDITNFVLFETGQPLHAFDFDLLEKQKIVVRRARRGEKITTIDGECRRLDENVLVIADATAPVAIAGIMGGLHTSVTDRTRNILIESAKFDPVSVRRTSRRLALTTESSYRFERGVDPVGVEWASLRVAHLIHTIAGGKVLGELIDVNHASMEQRRIDFRYTRCDLVLGMQIPRSEVKRSLEGLGFEIEKEKNDTLTLLVPSFRNDVEEEIDVIEEIARINGYDRIPDTTRMPIVLRKKSRFEHLNEATLDFLSSAGFHEIVSSSFVEPQLSRLFPVWTDEQPLEVGNLLKKQRRHLRQSLMPCLLIATKLNQDRGTGMPSLFELGKVYPGVGKSPAERYREFFSLAILSHDYGLLRGTIEALLSSFRMNAHVQQEDLSFFQPSRSAGVFRDNERLGCIGQISERIRATFDLRHSPFICELDFESIVRIGEISRRFRPLPRFPGIARDLSLVLDISIPWKQISETIRASAGPLLVEVRLADTYFGEQIPVGKKGVMVSMFYRSNERTLVSAEIDAIEKKIIDALKTELNAHIRSSPSRPSTP